MAKQLELRRGTTQANNLFTGAAGEVTMDTDTKQLRVHDGVKTGGYVVDTLVAFQVPNAGNNYTWYRKYASGWVEQGGAIDSAASGTYTVTFPVTMADTHYTVLKTLSATSSNGAQYNQISFFNKTTTSAQTNTAGVGFSWEVKGIAA